MPDDFETDHHLCVDVTLRPTLEQARAALDAAVTVIGTDPEAACDDVIAARLLLNTALLLLDAASSGARGKS